MSYTHGGGIDRPLALHKEGQGSLIPHENWRGGLVDGVRDATGQKSIVSQPARGLAAGHPAGGCTLMDVSGGYLTPVRSHLARRVRCRLPKGSTRTASAKMTCSSANCTA